MKITNYKKLGILVSNETFEKLLENKEVYNYFQNFGLQNLIEKFHISKSKHHSLRVNAINTDELELKALDSTNLIYFKKTYVSSTLIKKFESENGLLTRLGLDNKFIKISNRDGLFYIQNIYALIGIPSKAKEFFKGVEIPKIKTETEKLVLRY